MAHVNDRSRNLAWCSSADERWAGACPEGEYQYAEPGPSSQAAAASSAARRTGAHWGKVFDSANENQSPFDKGLLKAQSRASAMMARVSGCGYAFANTASDLGPPEELIDISVNAVRHMLVNASSLLTYRSSVRRVQVHLKIPFAEPDELPCGIISRLGHFLAGNAPQWSVAGAAMRRGCIELVLDLVQAPPGGNAGDNVAQGAAVEGQHVEPSELMQQAAASGAGSGVGTAAVAAAAVAVAAAVAPHGPSLPAAVSALDGQALVHTAAAAPSELDVPINDWIHWLYLQWPADAELLVQACGRAFVSRWDDINKQWTADELAAQPQNIPRLSSVNPCCALAGPPRAATSVAQAVASVPSSVSTSSANSGSGVPQECGPVGSPGPQLGAAAALPVPSSRSAAASISLFVTGSRLSPETTFLARSQGRYLPISSSSRSTGIRLDMPAPSGPGLLLLECWSGRLLSNWKPVVVVDDAEVVQELNSLMHQKVQESTTRSTDDLLTDLGCWLEFAAAMRAVHSGDDLEGGSCSLSASASSATTAAAVAMARSTASANADGVSQVRPSIGTIGTPVAAGGTLADCDLSAEVLTACRHTAYQDQMMDIGMQLLEFFVDQGGQCTANRIMVDMVSVRCYSYQSIVSEMATSQGLSLLHRAVRSGKIDMVQVVLDWGITHGMPWSWDVATPEWVTPLHLAAALSDDGLLANWVLANCGKEATRVWLRSADSCGCTPADIAARARGLMQREAANAATPFSPVVNGTPSRSGWSRTPSLSSLGLCPLHGPSDCNCPRGGDSSVRRRPGRMGSTPPGGEELLHSTGITEAGAPALGSVLAACLLGYQSPPGAEARFRAYVSGKAALSSTLVCILVFFLGLVALARRQEALVGQPLQPLSLLLYAMPYVLSLAAVALTPGSFGLWREVTFAVCSLMRMLIKARRLTATTDMEVLIEGLFIGLCEQVTVPLALLVYVVDILGVSLMNLSSGLAPNLASAVGQAAMRNLLPLALRCVLDFRHRLAFETSARRTDDTGQ